MHDDRQAHETPQRQGEPDPAQELSPAGRRDARSGDDVRRRGWFWHWNGIITQYTPLIGLKGVGLLNSYTAWTDRREHSPHRGYAFPSQRAESAFYGEDRAELITINKILVALDLIEIRKEMVTKTDEQGRNWRVPHNFYRVKDRTEGLDLTAADVLSVVELADGDAAVYRYIRKIFSSRFQPIDRDNVWHRILEEVAEHPTWQKLQARARKQEERASARTKAGHKARKAAQPASQDDAPTSADAEAVTTDDHGGEALERVILTAGQINVDALTHAEQQARTKGDQTTSVDRPNQGSDVADGVANRGWTVVADPPNHGSSGKEDSSAEPSNTAQPSLVEASNPTYYQEATTTTTTTTRARTSEQNEQDGGSAHTTSEEGAPGSASAATLEGAAGARPSPDRMRADPARPRPDDTDAWGPLDDPSALVVSLFEAANDRRATPLERVLLSELERDASRAAEALGSTGTEWVAAALREAVESGSAFVAPRRIREIINRWTTEGDGPRIDEPQLASTPSGHSSDRDSLWPRTQQVLQQTLERSVYHDIVSSSAALRRGADHLVVGVPDRVAHEKLDTTYRALIERTLARVAGRELAVHFVLLDDHLSEEIVNQSGATSDVSQDPAHVISTSDAEQGRQLWERILGELSKTIPARDRPRIHAVLPLGQDPDGSLVLGVNNRLAQELIESRYADAIGAVLSRLFGKSMRIRVASPGAWKVEDD